MAHEASIPSGHEPHAYGISKTGPTPQTQPSSERNRSVPPGGDSARSLHGPARTVAAAAGLRSGVSGRDHQPSISPPAVLGETGSIYRFQDARPWDEPGSALSEQVLHAYVLDLQSRGRRPKTIRSYLHALWYWPVEWPTTTDDMLAALAKLQGRSPRTRHNYMVVWGTFGKFAEEKFGLPNVVPDLPHEPVPRTLRNVPGEHEVQALMASCRNDLDRALVHLLAGTGIRWGEIPLQRTQIRGDHFYTAEGKTGMRMVPLPVSVADSLARIGDQKWLWISGRTGRPFTLEGLLTRFRRLRDRFSRQWAEAARDHDGDPDGLTGPAIHLTPHLLRHFFAVQFLESGGDLRALQEILGHREISTTAIYLTVTVRHLKAAMNRHSPADRINGSLRDQLARVSELITAYNTDVAPGATA